VTIPRYPSCCLKYYRAESDGWRYNVRCVSCVTRYQNRLPHFPMSLFRLSHFPMSLFRWHTICRRQPLSVLALASNTFWILELDQFVLTSETTYSQYVQAVGSRRVPTRRLLPLTFPVNRLSFRCDFYNLLHHCPGCGIWEIDMKRSFRSDIETIRYLAVLEHLFWCRYCKRGLFFYPIVTLPIL
jgi:hypothetical protein